jgi:uncharacterized protein involved in outer membrane biogenesis
VNQFAAPVQKKVKKATGSELTIGGRVQLLLGLEPKIVFDDVRLANAPWAKDRDFASSRQLAAHVAVLPLLQRCFEVVRLNLVEPSISLETVKNGRVNCDFGAGVARTTRKPRRRARVGSASRANGGARSGLPIADRTRTRVPDWRVDRGYPLRQREEPRAAGPGPRGSEQRIGTGCDPCHRS